MKLSLITVALNSAETIGATLKSVAAQALPPYEHIIIDGASQDGTAAIVRSLGTSSTRLISEPDQGIYDAMNKGLGLASGDVVGFLNADDQYASATATTAVAAALGDTDVDACYGDLVYVQRRNTDAVVRYWRSSQYARGDFGRGWCPPHPTFYVRRHVLAGCGGFDLRFRLAADVELMLRLLEVQGVRVRYIPEVLVAMRMGGATNVSWGNVLRQNQEIWQALAMHGIERSVTRFAIGKIASRLGQRLARSQWRPPAQGD
jgi:glycosyltransferase involved in cell wall biosynthesis